MKPFLLIFSLFFASIVQAQDYGFFLDYQTGSIQTIYLQEGKQVFKVDAAGELKAIFIFETFSEANRFFKNPRPANRARRYFNAGGVRVWTNQINSIGYCRNTSLNVRTGIDGEICQIGNIKLEYYMKIGFNSRLGIVGKLKRIGGTSITYHRDFDTNVRAGIVGRLKSIGAKEFKYYKRYQLAESANYVGKLQRIGNLEVKYHNNYRDNSGFVGTVKALGHLRFSYVKRYSTTPKKIVGRYKGTIGRDPRVLIY